MNTAASFQGSRGIDVMKKNKIGRIIGILLAVIIIAVLAVCAIWHKAAYAVYKNLTVQKYEMDESADWDGGKSYLKVPYAEESGNQYLDLYVPDTEDGSLPQLYVIIHGGGFIANDSQSRQAQLMYRYFRDHGYACATINYRLAQEEPFPGALCDCKTAIRFLRAHAGEYGYDAEKIPVFGESAGGYLAIMCSVTNEEEFNDIPFIDQDVLGDFSSKVDLLVDYYGVCDQLSTAEQWKELGIPDVVFDIANGWIEGENLQGFEDIHSFWFRKNVTEMTKEEYDRTNPVYYVEKNDLEGLSTWIIHGDCDITVPYLQSSVLAEKLSEKNGAESVRYHLIPGMGHASDPLYSDALLGELDAFMQEKLKQ